MITTILFDIYGTLIDISTDEADMAAYSIISKWLEYKGIYLSAEQVKWLYHEEFRKRLGADEARRAKVDVFKDIIDEFAVRVDKRKEMYRDADVRDVFKKIILKFTSPPRQELEDMATDLSHLFRASTRKRIFIYPVTKRALGEMKKKYRLGIVSNAQEAFTIPEMNLYGLMPYFETIVLSSQVGVKKPNSRIFMQALKTLNVDPGEVVFVGNDMTADIMGAGKLGMRTIFVQNKEAYNMAGIAPDAIITNTNIFDALTVIDRWNADLEKR